MPWRRSEVALRYPAVIDGVEEAIKGGGADSRLITADLLIRGVPVTEIDYRYKEKQHSLALLGFNSEVRGDSSLFDVERAILYAGIALLIIIVLVLFLVR